MTTDDDTLVMLCSTMREFVDKRLIPAEEDVEERDAIPDGIVKEMADLGLFGLSVPTEYGGLGLSMFEEASVVFEIGRASAAFRSYFGTTNGVGTHGLLMDGTTEQKERYVPRIAAGEMVASFALTEPDAGSDAASLRTRAVRDGNEYIIDGTKRYITNAVHAGLFTVYARTGDKDSGSRGISAFLVEAGTPGMTVATPYRKMGFRGSHSSDVLFENCRVSASALLGGEEGKGFKTAMRALDQARIHMAAVAVGQSERLIEEGLRYVTEREQFGRPIGDFQLIQGLLAECQTDALAARALVERTARRKDAGINVTKESAATKFFATEALGRIADKVLQMHGGAGYIKEYPVERMYRDARLFRIFEGTSQILQLVVARQMLKEVSARG
ncbi:MAG: acyl-CoA dehydrogenase [Pseudonocardiaceae bacterium]|nr:MAG: acyl-CoA dehydrogenase [Pseudonocardiaceae bacterium]